MTKDKISKLPTPETEAHTFQILSGLQSGTDDVVHAELARSLEQRLAAAVMALEDCLRCIATPIEMNPDTGFVVKKSRETLAAIRGDK